MSIPWSEHPNNTAIHTLADGTRVDTEHLPDGQRLCPHCMHLHPAGDIYTGPLQLHGPACVAAGHDRGTCDGHWARLRRGELQCVGCQSHGPHPDM
jgi:hypothetical protein